MLTELFSRSHQRYLSLPILGLILEEFAKFLVRLGYPHTSIRRQFKAVPAIVRRLQQQGCQTPKNLTRANLIACAPPPGSARDNSAVSATVKLLKRFFDEQGIFPPDLLSPTQEILVAYKKYLEDVRGFASSTARNHYGTALRFLARFDACGGLSYLPKLTIQDIEGFICDSGKRVDRGFLSHIISHLRSFLRFLAARREVPTGLDRQIDTPRIYRGEKLPRSLDWETVYALLQSVDQSTAIGRRDYAILLLITTYGLRASEVVSLKLEDVEWRKNRLRIIQRKTTTPLILPLTNAVGESIINYLRRGRPPVSHREIFVRHHAPFCILKPATVSDIFQRRSRLSGLSIPFQGPHCIRHSYAIHLLRQGVSLKGIGDILGHRNFESTCVYLRVAVDDLSTVPLSLPTIPSSAQKGVLS
jgi:integrase/recombinase XerD